MSEHDAVAVTLTRLLAQQAQQRQLDDCQNERPSAMAAQPQHPVRNRMVVRQIGAQTDGGDIWAAVRPMPDDFYPETVVEADIEGVGGIPHRVWRHHVTVPTLTEAGIEYGIEEVSAAYPLTGDQAHTEKMDAGMRRFAWTALEMARLRGCRIGLEPWFPLEDPYRAPPPRHAPFPARALGTHDFRVMLVQE